MGNEPPEKAIDNVVERETEVRLVHVQDMTERFAEATTEAKRLEFVVPAEESTKQAWHESFRRGLDVGGVLLIAAGAFALAIYLLVAVEGHGDVILALVGVLAVAAASLGVDLAALRKKLSGSTGADV